MGLSILGPDGAPYETEVPSEGEIDSGKTKILLPWQDHTLAIRHTDFLTAHDDPEWTSEPEGKGTVSAYTTAVIFRRLEAQGIDTSHVGVLNANTTEDRKLDMIPVEVVWRRFNPPKSSFDQRNPGHESANWGKFEEIQYEAYIKWSVIDESGVEVTDPMIKLGPDMKPEYRADGYPKLIYPKKEGNVEIPYTKIKDPNHPDETITREMLIDQLDRFSEHAETIFRQTETIQQTTFDTYKRAGLINADGKVEFGIDQVGQLRLGDVLDLDSIRNAIPQEVMIVDSTQEFGESTVGEDLNSIIMGGAESVNRIVRARHSSKQLYRDPALLGIANNQERAAEVVRVSYIPTAQALSNAFGEEVQLILKNS